MTQISNEFKSELAKRADTLPTPPTDSVDLKTIPESPEVPLTLETPKVVDEKTEVETPEVEETPVVTETVTAKTDTTKKVADTITNEVKPEEFEFENPEDGEFVKEIYSKKETTEAGKKDAKDTKEVDLAVEEKYQQYIEKANELDTIINDPLLKSLIEFRKNGGVDLNEFIEKTGIVNVEKMTAEQLYEADMKGQGLTPEEIETEMELFKDKSPYEKKKLTNTIKDELAKKRDEKLRTFSGQSEASQKVVAKAIEVGKAELDSIIPKMEGKKYQGLLITPEMAKRVQQEVVRNPVPTLDEKGQFVGFDIKESIRRAVILNFDAERSKALIEMGRTMGTDKALRARLRPSKNEVSTPLIPSTGKDLDSALEQASTKLWEKAGVKKTK